MATHTPLTRSEFSHLGEGAIGYLRRIKSEDVAARYPELSSLEPGQELWGLFAADGSPILLADNRDRALAGASDNQLVPVSRH